MAVQCVFDQVSAGSGRKTMRLAEMMAALSHALDLTEGQPPEHCIRGCWIGTQIGEALGFDPEALSDLYYTLLLKDLGCSSNAARLCQLYLTDDIAFKRGFKTMDTSMTAALRFIFAHTGLKTGLSDRIRTLVTAVQNGGKYARELMETRCTRGADIAAKLRFSPRVQEGIRGLDEHWDGGGQPYGLRAEEIPLASNIALLAQVVDVFHTEQGPAAALSEAQARAGKWFSPAIVQAFEAVQAEPGFWDALRAPDLADQVMHMPAGRDLVTVDDDYLDDVAAAFADVVDAKSPFTADHSNRVTLYSDMIAEELGVGAEHRRWLRRAALLHDLGKLGVSNQILDKPGKLDPDEWEAIKLHPIHSEAILNRVSVFSDIAPIAAAHHERLDGKGYPYALVADEIPLEARILTVADVFDALSAERPYRAAMPLGKVQAILEGDIGTAFDGDCVAALKRGLTRLGASFVA